MAGTDLDPALFYAGAAGGGVWKSTNGGADWSPVFDKAGSQSIGAIAISPKNAEDVWVGTGEPWLRNDVIPGDGIYHSTDGAKTWTRMGLAGTSQIARVLIDPRDPRRVVVAALGDPFRDSEERGVFVTRDGGASWSKTLYRGPGVGASDLAMDPKNPDVLYAGLWRFRRSSWNLTSGGADDGLYKSTDGGATWARLTGNGLPAGTTGRIGLAIAPSDPKRVYALIESKEGLLWRSDDGGATWAKTSSNTLINERPFYYSRVVVDPHDENHLFSVSVLLSESRNGGKTWHVSGKRLHGDHHDLWIAAGGRTILEANDGGAAVSRDGGGTWEWRNVIPIAQFYHVAYDTQTPYRVCGGLQDNGEWCGPVRTGDERGILPQDWTRIGGGDGTYVVPDPHDPGIVYAAAGGGDNAGSLVRWNARDRSSADISPYLRDQNVVAPARLKYRFNWETPIAVWSQRPPRCSSAETCCSARPTRHDVRSDQPRPHPQPQGAPRSRGRTAHAGRDGRRDVRHDSLHRDAFVRARRDLGRYRRRAGQLTRDDGKHWANISRSRAGRGRAHRQRRRLGAELLGAGVRRGRPSLRGRPHAVRLRHRELRPHVAVDRRGTAAGRGPRRARGSQEHRGALRRHRQGRLVEPRPRRVVERVPRPAAAGRGARHRRPRRRPDRRHPRPRPLRLRRPHPAARRRLRAPRCSSSPRATRCR